MSDMVVQFFTADYNDFKMIWARFKPEVPDVYYRDAPYSGLGGGAATFDAWAVDYLRNIYVHLSLSQNGISGIPTDITPPTFLADFPQAVTFGSNSTTVTVF